jgi:SAM-dependent methyltransferase
VTGGAFTVCRCGTCGLGFTSPQPATTDEFYPVRYRRYSRISMTVLKLLYAWRARGWARQLGGPGLALEIGCGDGWMLRALRAHGWRVIGTERARESAAFAAGVNRLPVFVGGPAALRTARFDVIVLFQVLEHLAEPTDTLAECARLLRPGGRLIIAVPNFASWQARAFGAAWFHLDVPRHLYHFTPDALARALDRAGLDVARVSYRSLEHDPYGWVQSALNRLGFEQNLLTQWLAGTQGRATFAPRVWAMVAVSLPLALVGIVLAVVSWIARKGALVEVWGVRR